jgi:hypothetical protein
MPRSPGLFLYLLCITLDLVVGGLDCNGQAVATATIFLLSPTCPGLTGALSLASRQISNLIAAIAELKISETAVTSATTRSHTFGLKIIKGDVSRANCDTKKPARYESTMIPPERFFCRSD